MKTTNKLIIILIVLLIIAGIVGYFVYRSLNPNQTSTSSSTTGSWSTNSTGGGGDCTGGAVSNLSGVDSTRTAHNNMQPYIVVNRWHRTA